MIFCLNIEDFRKSIVHRLQTDQTWAECDDPTSVSPRDYTSADRNTILNLQIPDLKITIGDKEYTVDNSMGFDFHEMSNLHYVVYGYRNEYPELPIRRQLEQILLAGNDNRSNTLILKTDGLFSLIEPTEITHKSDPEIIFQFEGFNAGNGYVGPTIQDENFDKYTENYFRTGMHYWRNHLVKKEMHKHADNHEGTTIDDLLDIYANLESIRW